MGAAHLREQRIGLEAASQRAADTMLGQHVQRQPEGLPGFDGTLGQRLARGRIFDQFQCMRGHADDVAGFARAVPRPPGTLQQAGHALGAADLQHLVDCREIHAQVQAGGGDHAAQPALAQGLFHFTAQGRVQ